MSASLGSRHRSRFPCLSFGPGAISPGLFDDQRLPNIDRSVRAYAITPRDYLRRVAPGVLSSNAEGDIVLQTIRRLGNDCVTHTRAIS